MALLDVRNVTRRFGDFVAVDDVSFSVNAGEFFTLSARTPEGRTSRFRCGGKKRSEIRAKSATSLDFWIPSPTFGLTTPQRSRALGSNASLADPACVPVPFCTAGGRTRSSERVAAGADAERVLYDFATLAAQRMPGDFLRGQPC